MLTSGSSLPSPAERQRKAIEESWKASEARVERIWRGLPPESEKTKAKPPNNEKSKTAIPIGVTLEDFSAYMPSHSYIYTPSREMWPAASVNSRIEPVPLYDESGRPIVDDKGRQKYIPANAWLDQNKAVEQMTWAPGLPMLIKDRLISDGGWIAKVGVTCFNLYRPPNIKCGIPLEAEPWVHHVNKVFGKADASHIIRWLAHRVQKPQEKINHALVLGGLQGIGKDTLLEPLKYAVGPWNFHEVSPKQIGGRFNGFLKSVILRVNEARDLGEGNRFDFYDHMKAYTAAPPDVLRVDEKHVREYAVFNVCGVIITTNYKSDGIYLPVDDRRHYVAWSDLTKDDFAKDYWNILWRWYDNGGIEHVAAYLAALDISDFDAKAPPDKTPAFWDIVDANRSPEDAELADALDRLGKPNGEVDANGDPLIEMPPAITLGMIEAKADDSTREWLRDRRNRRIIPHRLENCGYEPVRNDDAKSDGQWRIGGKRQAVYARRELCLSERLSAVRDLINSIGR